MRQPETRFGSDQFHEIGTFRNEEAHHVEVAQLAKGIAKCFVGGTLKIPVIPVDLCQVMCFVEINKKLQVILLRNLLGLGCNHIQ